MFTYTYTYIHSERRVTTYVDKTLFAGTLCMYIICWMLQVHIYLILQHNFYFNMKSSLAYFSIK